MKLKGLSPDLDKGPGYALLEIDGDPGVQTLEISIRDVFRDEYLGPSTPSKGTWLKQPHYFIARRVDKAGVQAFEVGPSICNHVAPDTVVEIASRDGTLPAEQISWEGIAIGTDGSDVFVHASRDVEPPPLVAPPPKPDPKAGAPSPGEAKSNKTILPPEPEGPTVPPSPGRPAARTASTSRHKIVRRALLGCLLVIIVAGIPFLLVRTGQFDLALTIPDRIDFVESAGSGSNLQFAPASASITAQPQLWAEMIEKWWLDQRPPTKIIIRAPWLAIQEFPQAASATVTYDIRPDGAALPNGVDRVETTIAIQHNISGRVLAERVVTVRRRPPAPGVLKIDAPELLVFAGPQGGPFSPSISVRLSADGRGFHWSTQGTRPDWLNMSPSQGDVADGASTQVNLSLRPSANTRSVGVYTATIVFTNSRESVTRTVQLSVNAPPAPPAPPAPAPTPAPAPVAAYDPAEDCDRLMANRFDKDRPPSSPFMTNAERLSDDDLELAVRACTAARQQNPTQAGRRFLTEAGRAYAARAEHLAVAGNDDAARAEMNKAVEQWQSAYRNGSWMAASFLGNYYRGTFNEEVATQRPRSLPPFSFNPVNLQRALDYFLAAAKIPNNNNATAMKNAGAMLLGDDDPRPPFKNVEQGIFWLEKAIVLGDMQAAVILGRAYYFGSPAEFRPPNVEKALSYFAKVCAASQIDPGAYTSAKKFFDMVTSSGRTRSFLDPSRRPAGC